jgi:hypothetical protein
MLFFQAFNQDAELVVLLTDPLASTAALLEVVLHLPQLLPQSGELLLGTTQFLAG